MQGNDEDLETYKSPLSVDYGRMIVYLYSALKQAITEIENLKQEIELLKSKIN